jgi:hypothetical protein
MTSEARKGMSHEQCAHHPFAPARPAVPGLPGCGFTGWSQRARLSANEFRSFDDQIEHRRLKKTLRSRIAPAPHWYRCMSSTADF